MTPCERCMTPVPGTTCPHCGAPRRSTTRGARRLATLGILFAGTVLPGCTTALYGFVVPPSFVDQDGDGFGDDEDCDDERASVHPGAEETAGDGVDSNCDGLDDPLEA